MANGGVIAPVGMNMVALAAQRHAVPFVVVAGSHKVDFYTSPSSFAT
jgi:translation initiation factor eIF-2B subunit beta